MHLEPVPNDADHELQPVGPLLTIPTASAAVFDPTLEQTPVLDGSIEASLRSIARSASKPSESRLQQFLNESSLVAALREWFGAALPNRRRDIAHRLCTCIATIDRLINQQVNAVIHDPCFQSLESSWRGLSYVVDRADENHSVKVRFFNLSAHELQQDQEYASDVEQSALFRKIYTEALSTPGGEPFGIIIGDYEVQLKPVPRDERNRGEYHRRIDVRTLTSISQIAAAAFCPFIVSASPTLIGINEFSQLEHAAAPERIFEQLDYLPWRKLREDEHARFVGITLPHTLMRVPYGDDGVREDGFRFVEDVSGPGRAKYLWGSAAYAFAGVLIRAFSQTGWFAHIRGVRRDDLEGGVVTGLPTHSFNTDQWRVAPKICTDVAVTDQLETQLGELGFLALCQCKYTEYCAFYTTPSMQKPQKYDRMPATLNAKLSAMLQYVLCVSRFAHYLKVIARHKVGRFSSAADCQASLLRWITQYICPDASATEQVKARLPLRKAEISVQERIDNPGSYDCIIRLWPHYALDELTGTIQVRTEIVPARV
jgi:type VI secretion system ImpC/EvpB family protein